jgi:hypothetical protein
MMNRLLYAVVALALDVSRPVAAADALALEWSDHARKPEAVEGDPVFMRTLSCKTRDSGSCSLTTISVAHECPLVIRAHEYRTDDGTLKVQTRGDDVEIEMQDLGGVTTLKLRLYTTSTKRRIIEVASGVRVWKARNHRNEPVQAATELVAYAKNTKGLEDLREYVHLDMHCSEIAVLAAKKVGK